MKVSKYIKLDQEQIRKDFPEVFRKYESAYMITARPGTKVKLEQLEVGQSIVNGDGESFHFLLTKVSPSPEKN